MSSGPGFILTGLEIIGMDFRKYSRKKKKKRKKTQMQSCVYEVYPEDILNKRDRIRPL
jgi:hypothetical protein